MLGLLHPCETEGADEAPDCAASGDFEDAAMFPQYVAGQIDLSQDDEEGVCFLYPAPDCKESGCPDGMLCHDGTCAPDCFGEVCGEDEICSEKGCVRECSGADCPGSGACTSNDDCEEYLTCREGTCSPGDLENGDPCTEARECAEGACYDGYCTTRCSNNFECGDDGHCELDSSSGACVSEREAFGARCTAATDCMGERCVALESKGAGTCSRACGDDLASCPSGWDCGEVDGEAVCVPPKETAGCTCGLTSKPNDAPYVLSASLAVAAAIRRLRRRRAT